MKFNFTYNKNNYTINSPYINDHIFKFIKNNKTFYEIRLLEKIKSLGKSNTVLDIGANIGNHTIFFSKECEFNKVYSFEISDLIYNTLSLNILENNLKNVVPLNIGISDKVGLVSLTDIDELNTGKTSIINGDKFIINKIDNIFEDLNDKIDLIKIDVEGHELNVLKGADKIIKKFRPIFVIEVQTKDEFKIIDDHLNVYKYKTDNINYCSTPTYIWYPI